MHVGETTQLRSVQHLLRFYRCVWGSLEDKAMSWDDKGMSWEDKGMIWDDKVMIKCLIWAKAPKKTLVVSSYWISGFKQVIIKVVISFPLSTAFLVAIYALVFNAGCGAFLQKPLFLNGHINLIIARTQSVQRCLFGPFAMIRNILRQLVTI